MIKQIVEINGKYCLRKFDIFFGWKYACKYNILDGDEIYWWTPPYKHYAIFDTLEEFEKSMEEYSQKREKNIMKDKEIEKKYKPKVIKTLWFKKL